MNCLRCGRETQGDDAFCDSCKETMKKYPVRPGTAVILPKNKESAAQRKQKRHQPPALQDQIRKLKKQRLQLRIMVICLFLILVLGIAAGAYFLYREQPSKPGQNYVVVETTAAVP